MSPRPPFAPLLLISLMLTTPMTAQPSFRRPPTTAVGPVADAYHGVRVADPYRWLEDPDGAETAAWVRAQNDVTFDYLRKLPEREPIRQRLTALLNYERFSVPTSRAGRLFFLRNAGLENQSRLYVQDSLEVSPRLLLDPNLLSADGTVALSVTVPSVDGRLLLYGNRVVPAHSFKFAAGLQAATAWRRPAYIRIETKAGHGAGKPIAKIIEERADVYAFTLANLAPPGAVP